MYTDSERTLYSEAALEKAWDMGLANICIRFLGLLFLNIVI